MQKPKYNTIILAGGQGSRMRDLSEKLGLPKHLFPINEGKENPTERLIRQISSTISGKVFVVVNPGQKDIFKKHLPNNGIILEKEKESKPFLGDLESAYPHLDDRAQTIIVTGDLVFEEEELRRILETNNPKQLLRFITDRNWYKKGLPLWMTFIQTKLINDCITQGVNPEDKRSMLQFVLKYIGKGVRQGELLSWFKTMQIIANLNTPTDYEKVQGNLVD